MFVSEKQKDSLQTQQSEHQPWRIKAFPPLLFCKKEPGVQPVWTGSQGISPPCPAHCVVLYSFVNKLFGTFFVPPPEVLQFSFIIGWDSRRDQR